jgi:hypothetical protein
MRAPDCVAAEERCAAACHRATARLYCFPLEHDAVAAAASELGDALPDLPSPGPPARAGATRLLQAFAGEACALQQAAARVVARAAAGRPSRAPPAATAADPLAARVAKFKVRLDETGAQAVEAQAELECSIQEMMRLHQQMFWCQVAWWAAAAVVFIAFVIV